MNVAIFNLKAKPKMKPTIVRNRQNLQNDNNIWSGNIRTPI